jgi:hypothetical protein
MKTINRVINTAYSFGAAIVVYGAWCKILHKSGANFFLTLGLITEVVIFTVYGVVEWFTKPEETVVTGKDFTLDTHQQANTRMYDREIAEGVKETNSILRNVFNTK